MDVISLVRNTIATSTNRTAEIAPAATTADTLLPWDTSDEFQPFDRTERLREDIDNTEPSSK